MPKAKTLIAGRAIGGLAAAGCLLQAGYDVDAFGQANALTEIGAGIQFNANAVYVLRHLRQADEFDTLAFRPEAYNFRLDVADALALYQRNRSPRTAWIVNEFSAKRSIFHTESVDELRTIFAKRSMGDKRNHWLYSYHPLEVALI